MKVHMHSDQFDGHPYPWCGRGTTAVPELVFEAADPDTRCKICERDWFPTGQPEWHRKYAIEQLKEMQHGS